MTYLSFLIAAMLFLAKAFRLPVKGGRLLMCSNRRESFMFEGQKNIIHKTITRSGILLAAAAFSSQASIAADTATVTKPVKSIDILNKEVIKRKNDKRKYEAYTLPNGIQVLLVSDPDSMTAAAALDVHVGSLSDPKTIPGMAHFCEHMSFLGCVLIHSILYRYIHKYCSYILYIYIYYLYIVLKSTQKKMITQISSPHTVVVVMHIQIQKIQCISLMLILMTCHLLWIDLHSFLFHLCSLLLLPIGIFIAYIYTAV